MTSKTKVGRLVGKAKDEHAARQEKAESDIVTDAGVAGSRANTDGKMTAVTSAVPLPNSTPTSRKAALKHEAKPRDGRSDEPRGFGSTPVVKSVHLAGRSARAALVTRSVGIRNIHDETG